MLGKFPDRVIAERLGVSQQTISYHRNKLGIPPARKCPPPDTAIVSTADIRRARTEAMAEAYDLGGEGGGA